MKIKFELNREPCENDVTAGMPLSDLLRDTLQLTGTKRGCDNGGCGMCTVIVNGKSIYSCMTPAWRVAGKKVETVEGLQIDGKFHPLQEAFIKLSAPQCGYCTSGILMAAKALLDSNPSPTDSEIRDSLCGVLCRCTGYQPYFQGIKEAVARSTRTGPG